jgi:hypothetical protein
MMKRMRTAIVTGATLSLALAASALSAGPLLPAGPEIPVGVSGPFVSTDYRSGQPRMAIFPDGGFVVVWQEIGGIRGRLFDRNGVPQTGELQLLRAHSQTIDGVAVVPAGFVVVWDQFNSHSRSSVFAAIFDRGGHQVVPPFKAHANSPFLRYLGLVAAAPDGGFTVAWMGDSGDPVDSGSTGRANHSDVFARFFDADGDPKGPEIPVVRGLSYDEGGTLDGPTLNAIAVAMDGSAVLAMDGPDGPILELARISGDGAPLPIAANDTIPTFDPTLATAADGSFTLASTNPTSGYPTLNSAIQADRFDAAGNLQSELQLNFRGRFEVQAKLAYLPDGSLVAIWTDRHGRDGDGYGVYGRILAADGTPFGPDFRVNSTTAGNQVAVALAGTPDGRAIALFTQGTTAGGGLPIVVRFLRPPS